MSAADFMDKKGVVNVYNNIDRLHRKMYSESFSTVPNAQAILKSAMQAVFQSSSSGSSLSSLIDTTTAVVMKTVQQLQANAVVQQVTPQVASQITSQITSQVTPQVIPAYLSPPPPPLAASTPIIAPIAGGSNYADFQKMLIASTSQQPTEILTSAAIISTAPLDTPTTNLNTPDRTGSMVYDPSTLNQANSAAIAAAAGVQTLPIVPTVTTLQRMAIYGADRDWSANGGQYNRASFTVHLNGSSTSMSPGLTNVSEFSMSRLVVPLFIPGV